MSDQDLRNAFTLFDANRDGRITASELGDVLKSLNFHVTPTEVEQMIREADTDGNGTVELSEFLELMHRHSLTNKQKTFEEELQEAFSVFDHNQDSVIDFGEIKRTMHLLGLAVTDEEVHQMIKEADTDHDGLVNFEEFRHMMTMFQAKNKQE